MLQEIKLPEISEGVESGEVIGILVAPGQHIEKDQPVIELETDKAAFEVPSNTAGTVTEIAVEKGQNINIGQTILSVETEDKQPEISGEQLQEEKAGKALTAESVEPVAEAQESAKETPVHKVSTSPAVRGLARRLGIEINEIPLPEDQHAIREEDVFAYAQKMLEQGKPGTDLGQLTSKQRPLPELSKWGPVERKPMSKTRKTIAENISYSWSNIPMVTQYAESDITALEEFRRRHSTEEVKISLTAIMVKISAAALKKFPEFNSSLDESGNELIYRNYYHISTAIDTDRGLLVGVIRDADKKGIIQISAELAALAGRARNKEITPEEMQGGGFTVSNLGGLGAGYFSPIVYWPQVAILAVAKARQHSVATNRHAHNRLMLPLAVTYDHRVIDGADGARFINFICDTLQSPFVTLL